VRRPVEVRRPRALGSVSYKPTVPRNAEKDRPSGAAAGQDAASLLINTSTGNIRDTRERPSYGRPDQFVVYCAPSWPGRWVGAPPNGRGHRPPPGGPAADGHGRARVDAKADIVYANRPAKCPDHGPPAPGGSGEGILTPATYRRPRPIGRYALHTARMVGRSMPALLSAGRLRRAQRGRGVPPHARTS
jgi:hypothetical protein